MFYYTAISRTSPGHRQTFIQTPFVVSDRVKTIFSTFSGENVKFRRQFDKTIHAHVLFRVISNLILPELFHNSSNYKKEETEGKLRTAKSLLFQNLFKRTSQTFIVQPFSSTSRTLTIHSSLLSGGLANNICPRDASTATAIYTRGANEPRVISILRGGKDAPAREIR